MKLSNTLASIGLGIVLSGGLVLAQTPPAQTPPAKSTSKTKDAPKLPKSIKLDVSSDCMKGKDKSSCVPDAVTKAVKVEYPKGTISKASKVALNADFSDYEFDVTVKNNGQDIALIVSKDGKVRKAPAKK